MSGKRTNGSRWWIWAAVFLFAVVFISIMIPSLHVQDPKAVGGTEPSERVAAANGGEEPLSESPPTPAERAPKNGGSPPDEPDPREMSEGEVDEFIAGLGPTDAGPAPPTAHAWQAFYDQGDEAQGYAMYTYVLIGSPLDEALPARELERYRATLAAIIGDTLTVEEAVGVTGDEEELRRRMATLNVFLLPATRALEHAADLAAYDSTLARRYLSELAYLRQRRGGDGEALRNAPGPFFVSVAWPLRVAAGSEGGYLLFADLSRANPAAIREAVHAYKEWLIDPERGEEARFDALRLKLLNALLNADDLLTLVRTAAADWRGLFDD